MAIAVFTVRIRSTGKNIMLIEPVARLCLDDRGGVKGWPACDPIARQLAGGWVDRFDGGHGAT
jgi:hypothetical protein